MEVVPGPFHAHAAPGGPQALGGGDERAQVRRQAHHARLAVVERGRERRQPGEAQALERVERIGDALHVGRLEAALLGAVEDAVGHRQARHHGLLAARVARRGGGLARPVEQVERPEVGLERGDRGRLRGRHLDEVADMAEPAAGGADRAGAGRVDGDAGLDAAGAAGGDQARVAPHLLRHREHVEAEPRRLGRDRARVALDRIEVDRERAGRQLAGLVQREDGLEEGGVAAAQDVEEHGRVPGR